MSSDVRFWHIARLDHCEGYGTPADWTADEELEDVVCPVTRLHNIRRVVKTGLLRVSYEYPKVPDILWPYLRGSILVQDHVLERLRAAGLTGFDVRPVLEVTMPRGRKPRAGEPRDLPSVPTLWELLVTGWGGEAAPESGVRMTYYCEGCGHRRYSGPDRPDLLIDPGQWDGSDFFIVYPLPRFVFVTERVASLIKREKWVGCRLLPPGDMTFLGDGLGPGPPPPGRAVRGPDAFPGVHIARLPPEAAECD